MNYLAIFAACIGVPLLIVSMLYLAWLAAEGDRELHRRAADRFEVDCDCQWCQERAEAERER